MGTPQSHDPSRLQFLRAWTSDGVKRDSAYEAIQALEERGIPEEALKVVLSEALAMVRRKWPAYADHPHPPDFIVARDEPVPYVSVRLPVPATPDVAANLSWALAGLIVEKRLRHIGLTVAFSSLQD